MEQFVKAKEQLVDKPATWLITGVAGFIGSNLLEKLLLLDQNIIGLDNFSTGKQENLDEVKNIVGNECWDNFCFVEGDIGHLETCKKVVKGVDYVLHQAALGSVPRSINDPITTHESNISGFLNMLVAGRDEGVKSFVYAASSSTYGDHPDLPKIEDKIGQPLSPYAVTKYVNELYAQVFARTYGFKTIGLRYFNVFGQRQDPDGAYAAVIPKWVAAMIKDEEVFVNGDGETSRDFCYIDNAVQANILAAITTNDEATDEVYNVAVGDRTSLNQLYNMIRSGLEDKFLHLKEAKPTYREFRAGDVRHSLADISKAKKLLGYDPQFRVGQGIEEALNWYVQSIH